MVWHVCGHFSYKFSFSTFPILLSSQQINLRSQKLLLKYRKTADQMWKYLENTMNNIDNWWVRWWNRFFFRPQTSRKLCKVKNHKVRTKQKRKTSYVGKSNKPKSWKFTWSNTTKKESPITYLVLPCGNTDSGTVFNKVPWIYFQVTKHCYYDASHNFIVDLTILYMDFQSGLGLYFPNTVRFLRYSSTSTMPMNTEEFSTKQEVFFEQRKLTFKTQYKCLLFFAQEIITCLKT